MIGFYIDLLALTMIVTRKTTSTMPCQKLTIARPGWGPSAFLPSEEVAMSFLRRFILLSQLVTCRARAAYTSPYWATIYY